MILGRHIIHIPLYGLVHGVCQCACEHMNVDQYEQRQFAMAIHQEMARATKAKPRRIEKRKRERR